MSLARQGEFPGFDDNPESRGPSWAGQYEFDRIAIEAEIRDQLPYVTDVQLMAIASILSAAEERVTRGLSSDDVDMYDNGVNP